MPSYGVYPTDKYIAVTPHDTDTLVYNGKYLATRGIACAVTGVIETKDVYGDAVEHYCVAGVIYPIRTQTIMDANTTATGIIAYFD